LAGVVLLMASTSMDLFDRIAWLKSIRFAKMAQVYGSYVWAYLLMLLALVLLLRSKRPAAAP
jgi:hypothetical protein